MAFFKPWTWFSSEERKNKLEEQKLLLEEQRLKNKELELRIQQLEKNLSQNLPVETSTKAVSETPAKVVSVKKEKVYASLRMTENTIIVVLKNGSSYSKECASIEEAEDLFFAVRDCADEGSIIELFMSIDLKQKIEKDKQTKSTLDETEEEKKIVHDNKSILESHPDFEIEDSKYYLKGVKLEMPSSVTASFIEILEKIALYPDVEEHKENYEAIKMFWYWTALNPIENSRTDLLNFVKKHDVNITKNGLLEMYRRVVSKQADVNKEELDFISKNYLQIKKWKKSPAKFVVWKGANGYILLKDTEKLPDGSVIGNLKDLYNDLPNRQENRYTDNHTKSKDIRVGQIYAEDEAKIDLNNKVDCSNGLHCGNKKFAYDGFGDTGVLVLVNPSKVRSVPVSDTNKMRVSEMFVAAILDKEDYDKSIDEAKIADFSDEYFNISLEELKKKVEEETFAIKNKGRSYAIPMQKVNINDVVDILSSKVVNVS